MAALTTHVVADAGTAPTFVEASASDTAEIGSGINTFVVYRNGSDAPTTILVVDPNDTEYGVDEPGNSITLAAGDDAWIPLRKNYDPADGTGRATLTTSAQDPDLLVAVVRTG